MTDQSTDTSSTESTATGAADTTTSVTKAKLIARQAYQTSDGQNFFDMGEAESHQAGLDNRDAIEAYLVKANVGKAQAGMLRNTLPAFLAFKASVEAGTDISDLLTIVAANEAKAKAEAAEKAAAAKAEADKVKAAADAAAATKAQAEGATA